MQQPPPPEEPPAGGWDLQQLVDIRTVDPTIPVRNEGEGYMLQLPAVCHAALSPHAE